MSWLDEYEKGSFRGAAFRTASHQRTGGRRVATHEFPGRDDPVVEDLGRRARQFSLECHVIGSDYRAARDVLIDALEASGPGLLVHPWHGRMMVSVLDYSSSESTDDGGMCWFQVNFGEAGQPVSAPTTASAGKTAALQAQSVLAGAPAAFAARFTIDGAAGFVEQAASDLIGGMSTVSQLAAGLRGGVGPALRAFDAGLRFLPDNLSSLVRAPLNLGQSIVGLVSAVAALGGAGGRTRKLAPLQTMLDWESDLTSFPERTPMRSLEADNRRALMHLFHSATAAELVTAAAAIDWPSYEDARSARDTIGARLDVLALEAADRGDDARAEVFDGLRRALARDIADRGQTLARVYDIQLRAAEPALVLAHRLYGGNTTVPLALRSDGIVARNRVRHPGFVPAGVSLELLTLDAA